MILREKKMEEFGALMEKALKICNQSLKDFLLGTWKTRIVTKG